MPKKLTELSTREEFVIEQFATMKKINGICAKLFDLYYVDIDLDTELSPMMRSMVPPYYVDPTNPEHPTCFVIPGQSTIPYLERMIHLWPYVNEKNKFEYEISGFRGLVIPPLVFNDKAKKFRKSKLEPLVMMVNGETDRSAKSITLRETNTPARGELVLDFLEIPKRKRVGDEAYFHTLNALIYQPWYKFLPTYLREKELDFAEVPEIVIEEILDADIADFITLDGDHVTITKGILPLLGKDTETHRYYIAKVPDPDCNTSVGRFHYVIKENFCNERGTVFMTIYTLLAAMQLR